MEWKPGLILRIRDYKFEDDGTNRDKYAIVLHTNDKEVYLIHSLTTSRNNLTVPGTHYIMLAENQGCMLLNQL